MKIKCKKCGLRDKVRGYGDIDCNRSDCDIKFNMVTEEIGFTGYQDQLLKDVHTITDWESEAPKPVVATEMTSEQWEQWCGENVGPSCIPTHVRHNFSD